LLGGISATNVWGSLIRWGAKGGGVKEEKSGAIAVTQINGNSPNSLKVQTTTRQEGEGNAEAQKGIRRPNGGE